MSSTADDKKLSGELNVKTCYELAMQSDIEPLRQLVGSNSSILLQTDIKGRTPLLLAATYGNLQAVRNLVSVGSQVNQRDTEGRTALYIASIQGCYEVMVYLLTQGADQSIPDSRSRLPIHASTYDSRIRCLAYLVQEAPSQFLNFQDNELMTPLHWAAFHKRPEHVQLLISKGANMFASDCEMKTALHWAALNGCASCVDVIVREAKGTNLVNIRDKTGKGAIHYAAASGHRDVISSLSKTRVLNLHLDDPNDRQPLHWAAAMGHTACVELLLELGADPTVHDINAKNALHYANKAGHKDCTQLLNATLNSMKKEHKQGQNSLSLQNTNNPESSQKKPTPTSDEGKTGDTHPLTQDTVDTKISTIIVHPNKQNAVSRDPNQVILPPIRGSTHVIANGPDKMAVGCKSETITTNTSPKILEPKLAVKKPPLAFEPTQTLYTEVIEEEARS